MQTLFEEYRGQTDRSYKCQHDCYGNCIQVYHPSYAEVAVHVVVVTKPDVCGCIVLYNLRVFVRDNTECDTLFPPPSYLLLLVAFSPKQT